MINNVTSALGWKKLPDKLSRVFRIAGAAALLVLMTGLQLNATSLQQTITVRVDRQPLTRVFEIIESQTGYQVMYNDRFVRSARPVTIVAENMPLEDFLKAILMPESLTYHIVEKTVLLRRLEKPVPEKAQVAAPVIQEKVVTGKVTDETGAPLAGVTVTVAGTTTGVITGVQGEYRIQLPSAHNTLWFSMIGFEPAEQAVENLSVLNITLRPSVSALEEIVVVGYGTQKKVNLTGAVDVVAGKELANRSSANIGSLLQGASPNLNIFVPSAGGEPGASPSWNIRGVGSLSGGGPLILVDGVEMNVNNLEPESVESISILKDAAASAIYGSRAPFGVVLITTKKGSSQKGVSVNYTNNFAFSAPINLPKMHNALMFATAFNQMHANSGQAPKFPESQMDRIRGYMNGTYTPEYDTINPPNSLWRGRHEGNANYDYIDLIYKDFSVSQKHNLSLSGGDQKTQYYISAGLFDQGSSYNWIDEFYRRYNILANFTSTPTKWLSINLNTKFANSAARHPTGSSGLTKTEMIYGIQTFPPLTPMYHVKGHIIHPDINQMMRGGRENMINNDLWTTLGVELEPVEKWKTRVLYNYNYNTGKYTKHDKQVFFEVPNGSFGNIGSPQSGFTQDWSADNYYAFSATTSYEKAFGGHNARLMTGFEQELKKYSSLFGNRRELISEIVPSISTATGASLVDDGMGHWSTQAVFGRFNYDYRGTYLFEVNARYNGSSRFAGGKRWALFPSFSAGYNLANESFWEPLANHVNNLKLRASYGALGNQNVPNYLYLSNVPIGYNLEWVLGDMRPKYAMTPNIISANLTWEEITTTNLGIDVSFLKHRLSVVADWYHRKTDKMFGPAGLLPAALGTSAPQENNASMSAKGWELSVSWKDQLANGLAYEVRGTLSDSRSVITRYLNELGLIDSYYPGKVYGEIWGYETDGLIQQAGEQMPDQSRLYNSWGPGDIKYKDLDGDNVIDFGNRTLDNHGDLRIIGNSQPRYTFGLLSNAAWKGFDMNMFWQGVGKRNIFPGWSPAYWGFLSRDWAFYEGHENYWRPADETNILGPNTNAFYPKPYNSEETDKNMHTQTRFLENAAYLRLKNLQIGYSLPSGFVKRLAMQKLRIYFSGENLLTFTKFTKLLDPETAFNTASGYGVGMTYPLSKSYSFGLNVTF